MTESAPKPAPHPLIDRFRVEDLALFDDEERARFLPPFGAEDAWPQLLPFIAWELLYRKEPDLYVRLIAGERIHDDVLAVLPTVGRAVEVAAGTGRLTTEIAPRCGKLVAIEPAAALRSRLGSVIASNVEVRRGFFDAIDVPDGWAQLVVSCSAFTADPMHGGEPGLREMERATARGGTIALVWPSDVEWLRDRGFDYQSFDGDMAVDFGTIDEALELAAIFYPDAVDEIRRRRSPRVPYELLGMNAPRDIAWKTVA